MGHSTEEKRKTSELAENYSPPSGGTSCSLSLESSRQEGRKNHTTVREAVGSIRSIVELQDRDEEGRLMVGYGDFRGFHYENPDSNFRELIRRIKKGYISDPTMLLRYGMLHKSDASQNGSKEWPQVEPLGS